MRNFNIGRDIDLKAYLPDVLQDVLEIVAIMGAETPAVKELWQAVEDCMDDQFISEATEYGIARREKALGIIPFGTDTLEDRRLRVLSRYNENVPYTRRALTGMLEALCGVSGFELHIDGAGFSVAVKVALSAKKQADIINETLERVLPYNMAYTVELLYNTWRQVAAHSWGELAALTWGAIKEEVLPHGI